MQKKNPAAKHLLTLLLCVMMLTASFGAQAEGNTADTLLPLMDLTASAAFRVGETPETVTEMGTLSDAFVYNFFLLGQGADPSLGITADMLSDTALQAEYLSRVFSASQPALSGILSLGETYDYIGIRVMAADENEDGTAIRIIGDVYQAAGPVSAMTEEEFAHISWLDRRAVYEFHKDDAALNGWRLISFSVDAELDMEDVTTAYFDEAMVEYLSEEKGFALQYPAVFIENALQEDADSISATLSDGSASFFARREQNTAGKTLQALLDEKKQEKPTAETNINEISGCGKAVWVNADGSTTMEMFIVSDSTIYHAGMTWSAEKAQDFSLYAEYMVNSFTAFELGIG